MFLSASKYSKRKQLMLETSKVTIFSSFNMGMILNIPFHFKTQYLPSIKYDKHCNSKSLYLGTVQHYWKDFLTHFVVPFHFSKELL